jgi:4-hydroxybenzoate polyprenyltransferase
MSRRLDPRSSTAGRPLPAHPYRDSAVLHIALALVVLVLAWATGGGLGRALVVAVGYAVAAIAWSWFRFRQRLASRGTADGPGWRETP